MYIYMYIYMCIHIYTICVLLLIQFETTHIR